MDKLTLEEVISMGYEDIFEPDDRVRYQIDFRSGDKIVTEEYSPIGLAFNRIIWEIALRVGLPIDHRYCIFNYYTNGMFNSSVTYKTINAIAKDLILLKPNRELIDIFTDAVVWAFNAIYKDLLNSLSRYWVGADIVDIIKIQKHPEVEKAMEEVKKNRDLPTINKAYETIDRVIRYDEFKDNPVAIAYIGGLINRKQFQKMIGPRSFVTEIDSRLFLNPVTESFTRGIKDAYEWLIESRSPAKALYFSGSAISDSETTGRKFQLVTHILERLHLDDCGAYDTEKWMDVPIVGKSKDSVGSLPGLVGMSYLDPDSGEIKKFTGDEDHLIGKSVKVRTVFNCQHPDHHGVCVACYGDLGYNVDEHANLGYFAATAANSPVSQKILATKHDNNTEEAGTKQLPDPLGIFNNTKVGLKVDIKKIKKSGNEFIIRFHPSSLRGLYDLDPKKIDTLDIPNLTAVDRFRLTVIDKKGLKSEYEYDLKTISKKRGFLSTKFIKFILRHKIDVDIDGYYKIPLHKWAYPSPIIILPQVDYNFTELSHKIDSIYRSGSLSKLNLGFDARTPRNVALAHFTLTNSKLVIPFSHICATVLCFTYKSHDDFRLAKGVDVDNGLVGTYDSIIASRSLSVRTAYEAIDKAVLDSNNFIFRNKPDSMFDIMYKPNEVILWKEKGIYNGKSYDRDPWNKYRS